jgi:hypothetical protein
MAHAASAALAASPLRNPSLIAGWVMSGLFIAFFLLDAGMKLPPLQPVVDTWRRSAGRPMRRRRGLLGS